MGYASDEALAEEEDREDRWHKAAEINGYNCKRCGSVPPYVERETYFETKMCGYCAHKMQKLNRDD
jgi:hypothetical protein